MIKRNSTSSKPAIFISAAVVIAALVMAWPSETDNGSYAAYVKDFSDDSITVDIVEYITSDDADKMKEHQLTEEDLPDGYYIYNPDEKTTTWKLVRNTSYTFIDWGRDFVQSDDPEDLNITTTDREVFKKYLDTYDPEPGMPFFFEVREGVVQSIVEEPMM